MTQLTLFIKEEFGVNSVEILLGGDFMKIIVFILLSFGLAGEMEVDGGLTVTEGVTASSFVGNGGGLTGIGMKPERIYRLIHSTSPFSFTVPEGMNFSSLTMLYGSHGYGSYIYEDVEKFVGEYKHGKQWEGTLYKRSGIVAATWSEGVETPE